MCIVRHIVYSYKVSKNFQAITPRSLAKLAKRHLYNEWMRHGSVILAISPLLGMKSHRKTKFVLTIYRVKSYSRALNHSRRHKTVSKRAFYACNATVAVASFYIYARADFHRWSAFHFAFDVSFRRIYFNFFFLFASDSQKALENRVRAAFLQNSLS